MPSNLAESIAASRFCSVIEFLFAEFIEVVHKHLHKLRVKVRS